MNEVQIFNNDEFGQIRTVSDDNGVWFVGNDVGRALGYADPRSGVRKNVDDEDKRVCPVGTGKIPTTVINESGLYSLIFGSKLENAKKFKKWVTSEVLPSIRRTGGYQIPQTTDGQIKLLARGYTEISERVEEIETKVDGVKTEIESLKMDLPILPIEADRITIAARRRGTEVLGGKQSAAYKNRALRQRVYTNLYSNLKYNFKVSSYKSIKRSQTDKAVEIIERYEPPVFLAEQIAAENAQQKLGV